LFGGVPIRAKKKKQNNNAWSPGKATFTKQMSRSVREKKKRRQDKKLGKRKVISTDNLEKQVKKSEGKEARIVRKKGVHGQTNPGALYGKF